MIRTRLCAAASLLLVGVLYAEDKEKNVNPDKKPEVKADVVKEKSPDSPKKEGKEAPDAAKKPTNEVIKKEGAKSEGGLQKGRVEVKRIENGIITFSVNGHEYQFAVTENTHGSLKIRNRDGKDVVVSLQLDNYSDGNKKDVEKKNAVNKEQPKNPGTEPIGKPESLKN